jgi:hypothetical protein
MTIDQRDRLDRRLADARKRLPGPDYYEVLGWIHRILRPLTYIEIGVRHGASLALAACGTLSVGVDPAPEIVCHFAAQARIFAVPSDSFFESQTPEDALGQSAFDLAFLDGLHLFEQALRDFMHLERWAHANSVILIHDCLPLDQTSSARTRTTTFYSGDVWKLAACLKRYRPDIQIATIRTAPTGLCIASRLDPSSELLVNNYTSIVAEYETLDFSYYESNPQCMPDVLMNDYAVVAEYFDGAGLTRR